ncbi:PAS domain-containing protein [Candidatus Saccharibacteria bacterium]|nr:PAS domain-containing protein [Candidatus Saccharibacteria bacterium]
MGILDIFHKQETAQPVPAAPQTGLAEKVLNSITEGVLIVDGKNIIQMINPAAVLMTGCGAAENAVSLDIGTILKFENSQGMKIEDASNLILAALNKNEALSIREYILVTAQGQKKPVAVTVTPMGGLGGESIVTVRDITKEREEEGAQMEFISTASHEMRTPVASIEGYLGLALNPQTATIDDRARKYLEEAHASSKHLGKLFQDLLDTTKLDDGKLKVHMTPVEVSTLVRSIVEGQVPAIAAKGLQYSFGSPDSRNGINIEQLSYASVDVDFLREVVNNLLENAIKYTPAGGAIWVNVRGDGDRVLINVTDSGIGISPEDLKHIFQKFYRVDNSQTREIGGTGLGLYLVKQRVEAMGGTVWAESSFGDGSTFYISLPRLTAEEYERRKQIQANQEAMGGAVVRAVGSAPSPAGTQGRSAEPTPPTMAPAPVAPVASAAPPVVPPNNVAK